MNVLRPLALAASFACSDYGYTKNEPVDAPRETATTEPPVEFPRCALEAPAPPPAPAIEECRAEPTVGTFSPVTEWTWTSNPVHPGYDDIMAAPGVAPLVDTDADGDVDGDDAPAVVFTTFSGGAYSSPGAIVAVRGDDGTTLWSVASAGGYAPYSSSGVAIADLEGDGSPEVLVSAVGGLMCLAADGSFKWLAPVAHSAYGHPAIGDLDADGVAEIVYGGTVLDAWGNARFTTPEGTGGGSYLSFPFDLDDDGMMEIVLGKAAYSHDGALLWTDGGADGWPAVGDLDLDGSPEVIRVASSVITALTAEGAPFWTFVLTDGGGGPPTVADFDGDGAPEIGVASRSYYRVVDGDGTELWAQPVQDFSSSVTGSSVFDFEGDGAAEVVYADELTLWVYDGATGTVEMAWDSHSSGTLYEYPMVVDVDQDGAAEIVVPSNDYTFSGSNGITVIGDATSSWAPARPVWNQHAYSISNVDDDGGIPPGGTTSEWRAWNSFRAGNSKTAVGLGLPELQIGPVEACVDECWADAAFLWIAVANAGIADVPDVSVTIYVDSGVFLAPWQTVTTGPMPSGATTWLGPFEVRRDDFGGGLEVRVDDDGTGVGAYDECTEGDGAVVITTFPCDEA
jgi:hypothetical protein